ncbi:MAG: hypothetical protein MJ204_03205 [Bacteroidales bacterium]|nr:hypothetical protein [Bacteroidales bacterium]
MAEKYQNKYRVPSSRAPWHGYNGGVYFVTICTQNREHYFGGITTDCRDGVHTVSTGMVIPESQMQLSPIGQYAHKQFVNVQSHYPYAEIPLFVVMPNHIHAIVVIDGVFNMVNENDGGTCRDGVHTVSTDERWKSDVVNEQMQNISKYKGQLSVVIGGLKRAVTHFANTNNIPFA